MKLKITEAQLERLKGRLTEAPKDKSGGNTYQRYIKFNFNYGRTKLKGHDINDVFLEPKMPVSFEVEIKSREFGIDGISLHNISGPTDVEVEVDYFVNSDNTDTVNLDLKLDWSEQTLRLEPRSNNGVITIDDEIEIYLTNDDQGNLIVDYMVLIVFGL